MLVFKTMGFILYSDTYKWIIVHLVSSSSMINARILFVNLFKSCFSIYINSSVQEFKEDILIPYGMRIKEYLYSSTSLPSIFS